MKKQTDLTEYFRNAEKMIPWKVWDVICQIPEFLPYYEVSLSLVAKNSRDGTLDKSLSQRFLALYHRDLKKFDREEKEFESDLKIKQNLNLPNDKSQALEDENIQLKHKLKQLEDKLNDAK